MKIPKLASVFVFLGCLVAYLTYVKRHADSGKAMFIKTPNHPSAACVSLEHQPCVEELTTSRFQYGVMFDAGSTGTRIHVFKFLLEENEAPKLAHEVFKAIKPGLSAYADEPDKCKDGVQELLGVAMETVPMALWKSTPVVLKATAGLRLLPGEKATHLLDKVRNVFSESPFLSRADSVSIMDGTDEGVSAWITVNFLIGSLHSAKKATVGMLDLGGGSTQITFSPQNEKTIQTSPFDHITSIQMFNGSHTLYAHSYLGLGLMSARLAVLGGIEGQPLDGSQELVSPCLAPQFMGQWEHAEVQYTVKGQKAGEPIYESCYTKVEKVLYKKVEKAEEVKDIDFYAFSYYYDRAVDIGTIDEKTGGTVKVSDYIDAAKKACNSMEVTPGQHPFLCLDLTYISVLLQQLGFPKDKVFKLARKINDVETSWALGATFHYLESLRRH
ncbi:ectonucleoside triphosphate diphosphohydrolase 6 isoform X1 [Scleropages formosus]|uniref:nucleoside diphosphate phosphatase n=1 Tax=Scleropages formosus TaxID=113540 RepID=A0A8C9VLE6_SCLFO|nr:ectonucleoside triphosphate diphosphohydrolase 6 isoform X1 [Scleropages formosus]XP_018580602.1 ectonucleoside triphosphate diphosphohydrolase 6 isoform X1 [Scleropages formosus]XP_018580603.1 ectonucleoside triphosphate diphosphohydrolase 6 isoform X1 [Scleropages formosus]